VNIDQFKKNSLEEPNNLYNNNNRLKKLATIDSKILQELCKERDTFLFGCKLANGSKNKQGAKKKNNTVSC
jgi:hypothetical protein